MRFRVLNANPLWDYKEFNKVTQGIDICDVKFVYPKDEVEF